MVLPFLKARPKAIEVTPCFVDWKFPCVGSTMLCARRKEGT